jgi:rhodanese-related sulfurtransferase
MSAKTISLMEIQPLVKSGRLLNVVDVRTPAEFARVHAVGAKLIPLDKLDPAAIAAHRVNDREPIYLICASGGRASKACEQLEQAGVGPAFCIEGGTDAWERMGLPVERGPSTVISLERQVRIVAGSLVLVGLILGWLVHPLLLILTAFIGAGLIFAGITNFCGMAIVLGKMPWNSPVAAGSNGCPNIL